MKHAPRDEKRSGDRFIMIPDKKGASEFGIVRMSSDMLQPRERAENEERVLVA